MPKPITKTTVTAETPADLPSQVKKEIDNLYRQYVEYLRKHLDNEPVDVSQLTDLTLLLKKTGEDICSDLQILQSLRKYQALKAEHNKYLKQQQEAEQELEQLREKRGLEIERVPKDIGYPLKADQISRKYQPLIDAAQAKSNEGANWNSAVNNSAPDWQSLKERLRISNTDDVGIYTGVLPQPDSRVPAIERGYAVPGLKL